MSAEPDAPAPEEETSDDAEPRVGPFRKAALDAREQAIQEVGVLRYAPGWLTAAYWVLLLCVVGLVSVASCARVNEYARGPAVVTATSKLAVVTQTAGSVEEVFVRGGATVVKGQALVQLSAEPERAEFTRLEAEYETQLARSLLDRSDRQAREAVVALRTQLEAARAKLLLRTVRAPRSGRVGDVRARAGEPVAAGAPVVTMLDERPNFQVVALLPGSARAELRAGMPLRLEVSGYPYAYQTVRVVEVGPQVIGPAEARRLLGAEAGDAVTISGPVTPVVAELTDRSFHVDTRTLEFHDGMPAQAAVPVRQVRLAVLLLPWLRGLFAWSP